MARRRSVAKLLLVLVVVSGALGGAGVSGATVSRPAQPAVTTGGLVWPGGGRMLSAPLVVGGNVIGRGSLEMVGDTITATTANFDAAPPELSLRLFTFVPKNDGGFSAILRFGVPIVVLHSWRGTAVRQTMTVVVTPPSGPARAVQMQPDGTTMNGTLGAGGFEPSEAGKAVISGTIAVFDIPSSFGASADWSVQAIVKVQADAPLHPNRPATGYAAGTAIVPIGLLTGASAPSSGWGVVDATTALTSAGTGPSGVDGLRPRSVRLEGTGKDLTAVVTLDDSPLRVPASDNPHLDLDLAPSQFATLEHPWRVTWLPNGSLAVTSAQVFLDALAVGDVPVTVSGNDVRFALGAYTPRTSLAQPPTPRLDTMTYSVTIPLGDETVNSADGVTSSTATSDTVDVNVTGPQITVTPSSTGVAAQGSIDAAGRFVALDDTDYFAGSIDQVGNVVMYTTTITGAGAGHLTAGRARTAAKSVPADKDYTYDSLIRISEHIYLRDLEIYKAATSRLPPSFRGEPPPFFLLRPEDVPRLKDRYLFSDVAESAGAQAGNPDWPTAPTVDATTPAGDDSAFAVSVTGGTVRSGNPIDVTTAWTTSNLLVASGGSSPSPTGAAPTVSKGRGPTIAIVAVIGAAAVIGGGGLLISRRQRARAAPRV